MPQRAPDFAVAFARLERQLVRRRLAAIELRLRLEIAALGALAVAFLFWQVRLSLASIAFARGFSAAAGASAASLAALALLGGGVAGARHAARLAAGFPGPQWLALPLPSREIHRHLARTSRVPSLWAAIPALAILLAGARIVPGFLLLALAAGFGVLLDLTGRLGCAIAFRLALRRAEEHPGRDPVTRVLAVAARKAPAPRLGAARWRGERPLAAFLRKDLLLTRRPGPARARLVPPLAFGALSLLAWAAPLAPEAVPTLALALALLAAAGGASWIVALAASDPFPLLRGLPIGVGVAWGARVVWATLGAITLAAGHALAAGFAQPPAPQAIFAGTGLAALAIGVLGANYAITLFPRADHAERVLGVALAVAMAASLMIPFLGWSLLLAALLHSARRLKHWAWLEAS